MKYFETHAHPDHPLVKDKKSYVRNMYAVGIERMVVAPITYESNYQSMEIYPEETYPEILFAKGLHPKCITNNSVWNEQEISEFRKLLSDKRVVAIKTGLDLSKKKLQEHQIKNQFKFLKFFMDLAEENKMPMVFHIRNAAEEAISYFDKNPLMTKSEIHCFTYDKEIMKRFIGSGVSYFGIGGMVTRSENVLLQEAVREMPLEMILLESDAPFVKIEGDVEKINTSDKTLPTVTRKIAELKGISEEEVADATYRNACIFFGLEN